MGRHGGPAVDRPSWLREVKHARASADSSAKGGKETPWVVDVRPGLCIRWAVTEDEPLRMIQVAVLDPDWRVPARWDHPLQKGRRVRGGPARDLPVIHLVLAGGGGSSRARPHGQR